MKHIRLDDHDLGLQQDLQRMASLRERRRILGWMLAGGATLIAGCGDGGGDSQTGNTTGNTSGSTGSSGSTSGGASGSGTSGSCIADPEETNGPYPSDGSNTVNGAVSNVLIQSGVVRSDIRSSFGDATGVADGVPLELSISLVNTNNVCAPLVGAAVYIWHCTAAGDYSLYSRNVLDENFLRGVQVSDGSGLLTFTTIIPGCYSGRYPHIHFEIYPSLDYATLYSNRLLCSQMAVPRDVCTAVYAGSDYGNSASNLARVTLASDGIFGDNSAAQIAAMTMTLSGSTTQGYTGSIVVGVPA